MKDLQLTLDEKTFVISAIHAIFPQVKIIFFGSRVHGNSKTYSDLDVALHDKSLAPLDVLKLLSLQELFAESTLTFKVDILDLYSVTDDFNKHIEETGLRIE